MNFAAKWPQGKVEGGAYNKPSKHPNIQTSEHPSSPHLNRLLTILSSFCSLCVFPFSFFFFCPSDSRRAFNCLSFCSLCIWLYLGTLALFYGQRPALCHFFFHFSSFYCIKRLIRWLSNLHFTFCQMFSHRANNEHIFIFFIIFFFLARMGWKMGGVLGTFAIEIASLVIGLFSPLKQVVF